MTMVPTEAAVDEVDVLFAVWMACIMSIADFAQFGPLASASSVSGAEAASESLSTVLRLRSHSAESGETTTARLPSFDATANSTVFGGGSSDLRVCAAHASGCLSVLNELT